MKTAKARLYRSQYLRQLLKNEMLAITIAWGPAPIRKGSLLEDVGKKIGERSKAIG